MITCSTSNIDLIHGSVFGDTTTDWRISNTESAIAGQTGTFNIFNSTNPAQPNFSIVQNGNIGIGTAASISSTSRMEIVGNINTTGTYNANNRNVINDTSNYVLATNTRLDTALAGKQNTINSTAGQIIIGNGNGSTTTNAALTFSGTTLTATNISGNGSGITGLTATQIPALATSKITGLDTALAGKQNTINSTAGQIIIGNGNGATTTNAALTFSGTTLTATNISGNGSGITGLTATQIPTLATSKISGLDTALSGKQSTINSTAGQLIIGNGNGSTTTSSSLTFSGTTLTAGNFVGNGSGLTNLPAITFTSLSARPTIIVQTKVASGPNSSDNIDVITSSTYNRYVEISINDLVISYSIIWRNNSPSLSNYYTYNDGSYYVSLVQNLGYDGSPTYNRYTFWRRSGTFCWRIIEFL